VEGVAWGQGKPRAKKNQAEKTIMFDKFLGFDLFEDLTETTWWTDTVFRGLEKGSSDKQESGFEVLGNSTPVQRPLE